MKKTESREDFQVFKNKYESISGLRLPNEYLNSSDVYVFKSKQKIIGGFILGYNIPLRTMEVFVSDKEIVKVSDYLTLNKCCEVCCFWIDRKFRKYAYYNVKFWIQMALTVRKQEKEFILFGTNSRGLAKMYGYPKKSLLFHRDVVSSKDTFVFIARRRDFFQGVMQIVLSKILKWDKSSDYENKAALKTALLNEVSK